MSIEGRKDNRSFNLPDITQAKIVRGSSIYVVGNGKGLGLTVMINNQLNPAMLMGGLLPSGSTRCYMGIGSYETAKNNVGDKPSLVGIKADSVVGIRSSGETGIVINSNNLVSTTYVIKY